MRYSRALHLYAVFTAVATLFLIVAGALVTSTGSGLAVPDWPLSYGMFFPPMVGGIFYEHGHRIVATTIGFLTTILCVWTTLKYRGTSVWKLSLIALGAVVLQGVLGGLTVIFLLPTAISVAHACLGQTFFCIVTSLALLTSPHWERLNSRADGVHSILPKLAAWTTAAIFLQLFFGAWMRHDDAGLAIPDFPLTFGHLIPPYWTRQIAVHFVHRVWAVVVAGSILLMWVYVLRWNRSDRRHVILSTLLFAGVCLQVTLGAFSIWTEKAVLFTTAHVVTGASLLAFSLLLTLLARKEFGLNLAISDFAALTKPRITALVCVTTAVGYYAANVGEFFYFRFFWTVLATAFAASGANALNEYWERDLDALMKRTSDRPLPAGRVSPRAALKFSLAITLVGIFLFWIFTDVLTTLLAALTVSSYLFVYTPLKRISPFSTVVGAVPGAIPPMIGWAAASGSLDLGAWILFGILFLWQLPHFWAIAWLYRDDYARAGFPMLPVVDKTGVLTARQLLISCSALVVMAALPTLAGLSGRLYFTGALLLGFGFLWSAKNLSDTRTTTSARRVLLSSVAYLPLLLALLAIDKQ